VHDRLLCSIHPDRRYGDPMTLTNIEDGMQSEVYSETKGFAVRTIDLDSGCVVELRRGYPTQDMALAYAARILNLTEVKS